MGISYDKYFELLFLKDMMYVYQTRLYFTNSLQNLCQDLKKDKNETNFVKKNEYSGYIKRYLENKAYIIMKEFGISENIFIIKNIYSGRKNEDYLNNIYLS